MPADAGLDTAIAVIGLAGRFPGARDAEQFWRNLAAGRESITRFSRARLAAAGVPEEHLDDPAYVPARGAIDGADAFDAEFFGMTAREAEMMDPQQRLFLEVAWTAMEDAGWAPGPAPAAGVFAGAGSSHYDAHVLARAGQAGGPDELELRLSTQVEFLATRVSYKLGLTGPSLTVQSACSSALAAVHLACSALLGGECDLAIAGGVAVHLPLLSGYLHRDGSMLSPDGRCRPFDASANGTVVGDGAGAVVLRRLDDALDGGDAIYAVIRGSAVNNDGAGKVGFTAPGIDGQARVIRAAHAVAAVTPDTIDYVEAHGTGTPLGDAIEARVLQLVFGGAGRTSPLLVGSVKSGIGHLDAAAGIASLIKVVLSIHHGTVPATLHVRQPGTELASLEALAFPTVSCGWPPSATPRRAGVSAFGIGGTNAHVIVEAAPEAPRRETAHRDGGESHLVVASARTPEALAELAGSLAAHVARRPAAELGDVAYTLQTGRRHFGHRRAVVCTEPEDVLALTGARGGGRVVQGTAGEAPVAFVFAGRGGPNRGALADLCRRHPAAADQLERLVASAAALGVDAQRPAQSGAAGVVLFVQQVVLASLWLRWGVRPTMMLGCGAGEYAAACMAGVFSIDSALELVVARERLACTGGAFHDEVARHAPAAPTVPFISGATGTWITDAEATDPRYWASERPTGAGRLRECFEELVRCEPVVLALGRGDGLEARCPVIPSFDAGPGDQAVLHALGRLWAAGVEVDWQAVHAGRGRRRLHLPARPFSNQRHWFGPAAPGAVHSGKEER